MSATQIRTSTRGVKPVVGHGAVAALAVTITLTCASAGGRGAPARGGKQPTPAPASAGPAAAAANRGFPTVALITADGSRVLAQIERTIYVWQRDTGKRLATIDTAPMFRGDLTKGALVAVRDREIYVYHGDRYNRRVKLAAKPALAYGRAVISESGTVVAVPSPSNGGVGDSDQVGLWNAKTGAALGTLRFAPARVLGVALSTDGALCAVFGDAGRRAARLDVYRLSPGKAPARIFSLDEPRYETTYSAAFAPDRPLLALALGTEIRLYDMTSQRLIASTPTRRARQLFPKALQQAQFEFPAAHLLRFSSDGKSLLALHAFQVNGIARYSVPKLEPLAWTNRPSGGGTMRSLAADPSGQLFVVSSSYAALVWVHRAKGESLEQVRVLAP